MSIWGIDLQDLKDYFGDDKAETIQKLLAEIASLGKERDRYKQALLEHADLCGSECEWDAHWDVKHPLYKALRGEE